MTHAPVILYHDILSFFEINNKRTAFALKLANFSRLWWAERRARPRDVLEPGLTALYRLG